MIFEFVKHLIKNRRIPGRAFAMFSAVILLTSCGGISPESETALVSAVAALPSVTGGELDAGGMSARVRSICALADELTDAERVELLRHLQRGAAQGAAAGGRLPLLESANPSGGERANGEPPEARTGTAAA